MHMFGKDTPMERPNPGGRAAVFVPAAEASETVNGALRNGSGMVGFGNPDGTVTIYFENNKFNDSSLFKWESKLYKAYDRMVKRSPTVNKLTCTAINVLQVGFIEGQEVLVRDMPALEGWLRKCNALDTMPEPAEVTG